MLPCRQPFRPARVALALVALAPAVSALAPLQVPAQAPPARATARLAKDPEQLRSPTLVSTAWVERRAPSLVLLDAREKYEDFAAGHVPGARHVPVRLWREEQGGVPEQLLPRERLAAAVGALGIDGDSEVVLYGDEKLADPAHLALALQSLGHERFAILEGGLAAWKHEGRTLSTDMPPTPMPKLYAPRPGEHVRVVSLAEVERASAGKTMPILDVRPSDAFSGEVSSEARAGHIPGSINRPFAADLGQGPEGLFWRPLDQLRAEYGELGLQPDRPVIVSCRTGHQAAQTYFTLRYLLEYEDVRWYDGSWKEWAAHAELPVETGPAGK
jgi:thiosulfate/3-mercaptopyruvate sulfurtransferase